MNKSLHKPTFLEENKLWKRGYEYVIGVDEVGRGAFAGPVVVGAVVFHKDTPCVKLTKSILVEINDSKLLKPLLRRKLDIEIKKNCLLYAVSEIRVSTINKVGIGKATQMAFRKAISQILEILSKNNKRKPNIFVLVDGFHVRYIKRLGLKNQKAIIKGDQKCFSIAAASIIAKVHRDLLMKKLSKEYKEYGFAKNKGYGTKKHQEAIKKIGLTKIHRKSFNLSKFLS